MQSLPAETCSHSGRLEVAADQLQHNTPVDLSLVVVLPQAEKLVLAEGSKLAMVAVESAYNQGVYGLVSNLGSLVVRTLFQPFEEVAFVAFSR